MAKFTVEIDVYSDPICPWCYLGKEALDKAIAAYSTEHPDAEFKLTWKPYMLWPNMGVSAYDKRAALHAVYGPGTPLIIERFAHLGAQYGIDFKWEGKTGNSRNAHKVMLLAGEKDAAASNAFVLQPPTSTALERTTTSPTSNTPGPDPAAGSSTTTTIPQASTEQQPSHTHTNLHRTQTHLLHSAFQHSADLSSPTFLATSAVHLGLFPTQSDALAFFAPDHRPDLLKAVDASSARARQIGVSAVPSYVVQGRWQVGGMQGEGVWRGVFERVRESVGVEREGGDEGGAAEASEERGEGGGGGD